MIHKIGRTTGRTTGLTNRYHLMKWSPSVGTAWEICAVSDSAEPFAAKGDEGGIVFQEDGNVSYAVGMITGADGDVITFISIEWLLQRISQTVGEKVEWMV